MVTLCRLGLVIFRRQKIEVLCYYRQNISEKVTCKLFSKSIPHQQKIVRSLENYKQTFSWKVFALFHSDII